MAFVPNTIVKLLSVNFENDYKNVVYWSSLSAQQSEMESCVRHTFTEFTYQRKDNIIRIPAHIDTLYDCNYVMYRNKNHSEKWFYAFITDMEYINDHCTHVKIETDVWGTWWNTLTINESFVEREHTNNDVFGANTFPESLETGEYIVNSSGNGLPYEDNTIGYNTHIILAVTEEADGTKNEGGLIGGVYSGVKYKWAGDVNAANNIIKGYNDAGKAEAIQSIFMAPAWLTSVAIGSAFIPDSANADTWDVNLGSPPTTIDGYSPRNKKLLCYPYSFLYLTNQQGSSAVYHNEKFYKSGNKRTFKGYAVLCPGCSIRMIPTDYNNMAFNTDEGINLGKFPICNWNTDVYTNWITQNSVNVVASSINGAIGALGGALTFDATAFNNGLTQTVQTLGEVQRHYIMPDQANGNINCGDVVYASKQNNFKWIDMSIKAEYARIIDDFFDKYGYKTNRVKVPNMNHRPVWWFTKTIACNINAPIPQEDITRIRKMFDDGVTFWKVHSQVEHYELDNRI